MKHSEFVGTGVAMITPFRNGEIDFENIERIVEYIIGGGVGAVDLQALEDVG